MFWCSNWTKHLNKGYLWLCCVHEDLTAPKEFELRPPSNNSVRRLKYVSPRKTCVCHQSYTWQVCQIVDDYWRTSHAVVATGQLMTAIRAHVWLRRHTETKHSFSIACIPRELPSEGTHSVLTKTHFLFYVLIVITTLILAVWVHGHYRKASRCGYWIATRQSISVDSFRIATRPGSKF